MLCGGLDRNGHIDFIELSLDGVYGFPSTKTSTLCVGYPIAVRMDSKHRVFRCPSGPCDRRGQGGATVVGPVARRCVVIRQCSCSLVNAIIKRHGAPQQPVTRRFNVSYEAFGSLSSELQGWYVHFEGIWFDAWLEKWPQTKRDAIINSQRNDVFDPSRVKAFVKFECYHDTPTKARAIQMYVNLCTQAEYGPVFFALQKTVVKVLYRKQLLSRYDIRVTMASGMNPLQMGSWMEETLAEYVNPTFYERDAVNYDSSIQRPHFLFKRYVYKLMNMDPSFESFVNKSFKVRGTSSVKGSQSGVLDYSLFGTVKSGQNDTTLGNGLVNIAIAFEACVALGLKADIIVTGDDLIVVVEGDFDEHKLANVEKQYGIVPEYRKFDEPWQIEFASGVFISDAILGQVYVPKPGRLLARLFWTVRPPSRKRHRDYVHSVVCGQIPLCGSIPIIGDFLKYNDLGGNLINVSKKERLSTHVHFDNASIMNWLFQRYGLYQTDVEELQMLMKVSAGKPVLIKSHLLDRILSVDLCKLPDRFLF